MKGGEDNIADSCPDATVLYANLIDFGTLSAQIGPEQMVGLLNEIFIIFDLLTEKHGLEKIKTHGDGYLVAGGVLEAKPNHPAAVANLALAMKRELAKFNRDYRTSIPLSAGISTGPVVAGVIGRKKFAFDLWGDAVVIATHLAALGDSGEVYVDAATCDRLSAHFKFEPTQLMNLKARGQMTAFKLHDPKGANEPKSDG